MFRLILADVEGLELPTGTPHRGGGAFLGLLQGGERSDTPLVRAETASRVKSFRLNPVVAG